jgi:hypothetical protein
MRISFAVALISAFLAGSFLLSTPAAAIDGAEATRLCAKNPNCKKNPDKFGGGFDLVIKQENGQTDIVVCPPKGECSAYRTAGGKGGKVDPIRVLTASSTRTTGAGPKSPHVPPGNILDGGPGFSQQGPSGMGAPAGAPAAAPPRGPVLR